MVHRLSLATITRRWLGETPFVQVSTTWVLTCPEMDHQRPCEQYKWATCHTHSTPLGRNLVELGWGLGPEEPRRKRERGDEKWRDGRGRRIAFKSLKQLRYLCDDCCWFSCCCRRAAGVASSSWWVRTATTRLRWRYVMRVRRTASAASCAWLPPTRDPTPRSKW